MLLIWLLFSEVVTVNATLMFLLTLAVGTGIGPPCCKRRPVPVTTSATLVMLMVLLFTCRKVASVFTKALLMVALLLNWLAFRLVVSCSVAGTGEGGGGGGKGGRA